MKKSKLGYKRYSPDVKKPYNIIPSGRITMKDVDFPVYGIDDLGYAQIMYPGIDYEFPGNQVFEIPMAQVGAQVPQPFIRPDFFTPRQIRQAKFDLAQGKKPLTTEEQINKALGNPAGKAAYLAQIVVDPGEAPVDNIRHAAAGMYTADAIANKLAPYSMGPATIPAKALGFVGSNLAGLAHEIKAFVPSLEGDYRNIPAAARMSAEDMVNNFVGSALSLNPFMSEEEKENFIIDLSNRNLLPDGYEKMQGQTLDNLYLKKQYGGDLEEFGSGGLKQWFAEKWVDVKTGKDCGRSGKDKDGRPYPACRPSKRVNSTTPKTTSEMSSSEKARFKRKKTSSQRINYNHKRAQAGLEIPQPYIRPDFFSPQQIQAAEQRLQQDRIAALRAYSTPASGRVEGEGIEVLLPVIAAPVLKPVAKAISAAADELLTINYYFLKPAVKSALRPIRNALLDLKYGKATPAAQFPRQMGRTADLSDIAVRRQMTAAQANKDPTSFIKNLAEGADEFDNVIRSRVDDLSSPEGMARLANQEKEYLKSINYEPGRELVLDSQARQNALSRYVELKEINTVNRDASNLLNDYIITRSNTKPFLKDELLYGNAYYRRPAAVNVLDAYIKNSNLSSVYPYGLNIQKANQLGGRSISGGKLAMGQSYIDNVPIMHHEIAHALQRGRRLPIDNELRQIAGKAQLNPTEKRAYDYFKTGSKGSEPSAFANELRASMLQRGLINNTYDPIDPALLKNAYSSFTQKPMGVFTPNEGVRGKFTSNHRIFDFMEPTDNNFQILSNALNKLPALAPVGVGLGAAASLPEQSYGGDLDPRFYGAVKAIYSPPMYKNTRNRKPGPTTYSSGYQMGGFMMPEGLSPAFFTGMKDAAVNAFKAFMASPDEPVAKPKPTDWRKLSRPEQIDYGIRQIVALEDPKNRKAVENLLEATAYMENTYGTNPKAYGRNYTSSFMSIDPIALTDMFTGRSNQGAYNAAQQRQFENFKKLNLPTDKNKFNQLLREDNPVAAMAAARYRYALSPQALPDPNNSRQLFDYWLKNYNGNGVLKYKSREEAFKDFQKAYQKAISND